MIKPGWHTHCYFYMSRQKNDLKQVDTGKVVRNKMKQRLMKMIKAEGRVKSGGFFSASCTGGGRRQQPCLFSKRRKHSVQHEIKPVQMIGRFVLLQVLLVHLI